MSNKFIRGLRGFQWNDRYYPDLYRRGYYPSRYADIYGSRYDNYTGYSHGYGRLLARPFYTSNCGCGYNRLPYRYL